MRATTSGADIDQDGFLLRVDGQTHGSVLSTFDTLLTGLALGNHRVELGGLADNCDSDPSVATGRVDAIDVESVTFSVHCAAVTGTLGISVTTTGRLLDPDGYRIRINNERTESIGLSANLTEKVSSGNYEVALEGQASNCIPANGPVATGTIGAGEARIVRIDVVCLEDPSIWLGGGRLLARDVRGTSEVGLTPTLSSEYSLGSSCLDPTGRYLAYVILDRTRSVVTAHVMALNKSEQYEYSRAGVLRISCDRNSWSHDGTRLVLVEGDAEMDRALVLTRNLTLGMYLADAGVGVVWAPADNGFAFLQEDGLVILDAGGRTAHVTNFRAAAWWGTGIAWSSDGTIYFANGDDLSVGADLYAARAPDWQPQRLMETPGITESVPMPSPDGRFIAYTSRWPNPFSENPDILPKAMVWEQGGTAHPAPLDGASYSQAWEPARRVGGAQPDGHNLVILHVAPFINPRDVLFSASTHSVVQQWPLDGVVFMSW